MRPLKELENETLLYLVDSCTEHLEMYPEGDRIHRVLVMASKLIVQEKEKAKFYQDQSEKYRKTYYQKQNESRGPTWD